MTAVRLPALVLPLFAVAATPPDKQPIVVKGHAWAPFISPMGEPFRASTATDDTLAKWFAKADRNHDGVLTADEMLADGDRFFATLDTNNDGQIDPDELVQYEWEVAPDIQLMSRTRPRPGETAPKPSKKDAHRGFDEGLGADSHGPAGLQGAARYGLINMPEPVAAADANFDRSISLAEFRLAAAARFQLLDSERSGRLDLARLQLLRQAILTDRKRKAGQDVPDARLGSPLPQGN